MVYSDDTLLDYIDGSLTNEQMLEIEQIRQNDHKLDERIAAFETLQILLPKSLIKVAPYGLEEKILKRLDSKSSSSVSNLLMTSESPLLKLSMIAFLVLFAWFAYLYMTNQKASNLTAIILFGGIFTFIVFTAVDQYRIYNKVKKQMNLLSTDLK